MSEANFKRPVTVWAIVIFYVLIATILLVSIALPILFGVDLFDLASKKENFIYYAKVNKIAATFVTMICLLYYVGSYYLFMLSKKSFNVFALALITSIALIFYQETTFSNLGILAIIIKAFARSIIPAAVLFYIKGLEKKGLLS